MTARLQKGKVFRQHCKVSNVDGQKQRLTEGAMFCYFIGPLVDPLIKTNLGKTAVGQ